MQCNLCGSELITELGYIGIKPASVTSEPDLCSLPAKIYYCQTCHHLQKIHSETETRFINSVYENYETYKVSSGSEQLVFPIGGNARPRSYHAIEQCISLLPKSGNLLDIGTGNGAILKSANKLLPEWDLFAFDLGDKAKPEVLNIPKVQDFYSGTLANVPKEKFNLIVLWHCLEHISQPVEFLHELKDYLTKDGFLLIQVPDLHRTPFDLAVIDHWSHFTNSTLIKLCQLTGYKVLLDGSDWVHNCLTLLVKPDRVLEMINTQESYLSSNYFYWLKQTVEKFDLATKNEKYAIFGTGISGLWVSTQLSNPPVCFIDEDSQRVGNRINNIPIIKPENLSVGVDIVMPFTQPTGKSISMKLQKLYHSCHSSKFVISDDVNNR